MENMSVSEGGWHGAFSEKRIMCLSFLFNMVVQPDKDSNHYPGFQTRLLVAEVLGTPGV